MANDKVNAELIGIASIFRGMYSRVASRLDVDPSYVSRVARGERQSEAVEAALDREANQIIKRIRPNYNGAGRNGNNHLGRKAKRLMTH